jgi:hypothetical protein
MTPKSLYNRFNKEFPWFIPEVIKYTSKKDGSIDIFLKSGSVLNYSLTKAGWILKNGV